MNMRGTAYIMTWNDGLKNHDAILLAWLDAAKHSVIEFAIIGDAVGVSTSNTAIGTLQLLAARPSRGLHE